jgi:adenylate kinase family enzyme
MSSEHFRKLGKVRTVDSNRNIDEVYADVHIHFRSANSA